MMRKDPKRASMVSTPWIHPYGVFECAGRGRRVPNGLTVGRGAVNASHLIASQVNVSQVNASHLNASHLIASQVNTYRQLV